MGGGIVNSLHGETPPLAAVKLRDNTTPAYYLTLDSDSDGTALTADRTLIFDTNNTSPTLDLLAGTNHFTGPLKLTQNSDYVELSHDGTDAYFKTDDGDFKFKTDEGDVPTKVRMQPGGTSEVCVWTMADASGVVFTMETAANRGYLFSSQGALGLNYDAAQDVYLFELAASGENKALRQYGYITAGTAARYTEFTMDDTNDEFLIQAEDNANHEGVTIELPEANQEFRIRDDGVQKFGVGQSDTDLAGAAIDGGGVMLDFINESLADSGKVTMPASTSGGFGFIIGGDDASYAYFTYLADGSVTLVSHNNCSTTEDNDTTLNCYDAGGAIGINNELGGTYVIQGFLIYTPD